MRMKYEREQIVHYSRELTRRGLTTGTGGNISIFDPDQAVFALSPSGMDYSRMEDTDIVILDLEGKLVDGERKPSTELDLHRVFYLNRNDILAVVHTHAIFGATLAVMNKGIPPCHYLIGFCGRDVRCTEYKDFGTLDFAHAALEGMQDRYGVLLGNHGSLTAGADIEYAFNAAEELEFVAQIYYRCLCIGEPKLLSDRDMDVALEKFRTYGQRQK